MKHWRDWAMPDLWPLGRASLMPQALHYSYEKAGLTLHNQPIPWNAEAVVVEAQVRLPGAQRPTEFTLRMPGRDPVPPEDMRREDTGRGRLFFRFPPPAESAAAELFWRDRPFGQLTLPVIGPKEFLDGLKLQLPTVYARLGEQTVACQTFVGAQCHGLLATGLLTSQTSLAPLADLGLRVEFRPERGGPAREVPVPLSSSQLQDRQALVTVAPRKLPRRAGAWSVTWKVGDRVLAAQRVRAVSQATFRRSLRLSDTRFVVDTPAGIRLRRQAPPGSEGARVGPCFFVASKEPGMAGLCLFEVAAVGSGSDRPARVMEQTVLVSDGPTVVAPGTMDAVGLIGVTAFELRVNGKALGQLPLNPVPAATFTGEGGFVPPADFTWSNAADEELGERLGRLMKQ